MILEDYKKLRLELNKDFKNQLNLNIDNISNMDLVKIRILLKEFDKKINKL